MSSVFDSNQQQQQQQQQQQSPKQPEQTRPKRPRSSLAVSIYIKYVENIYICLYFCSVFDVERRKLNVILFNLHVVVVL